MTPRMKSMTHLLAVACLGSHCFLGGEAHLLFPKAQTKPPTKQMQQGIFLFSVERTGGFAGLHEKFNISPDGRVTNETGQTQQIPAQALEGIRRRVAELDVPKSCEIRVSATPCSDCFQYRIILFSPSGTRTLVLEDPIIGADSVSRIAKDLSDLVFGLKWW